MEATIEMELALVHEQVPDFAPRVARAIEEGKIDGSSWWSCFYGYATTGGSAEASSLNRNILLRLQAKTDHYIKPWSPIETLMGGAVGHTHHDHKGLATLYAALQPYLQQEEEHA